LTEDVQSVLDTLIPKEVDVRTKEGLWYSLRILPYRTIDNVIEGVVITFINISEIKKIQKIALEIEENYKGIFLNSLSAIAIHEIVLDMKGKPADYIFIDANFAFEKHTGLRVKDVLGKRVSDVFPDTEITNLIQTYGKVALTGKTVSFKVSSVQLQKTYNVCAYQISSKKFAVIFDSIGRFKNPEKEGARPEQPSSLVRKTTPQ
jgi:PAS domain-containing protein